MGCWCLKVRRHTVSQRKEMMLKAKDRLSPVPHFKVPPLQISTAFEKGQDEFVFSTTHRKSRILIVCVGWKGLMAACYWSTIRQQSIVRARSAICFICPHCSQPFIIQNRPSNYQCAFNNNGLDCHNSVQQQQNHTNICSFSKGWSPWQWPLHLPSPLLPLALFLSVLQVHGVKTIEQAARHMLWRYLTVMSSPGLR